MHVHCLFVGLNDLVANSDKQLEAHIGFGDCGDRRQDILCLSAEQIFDRTGRSLLRRVNLTDVVLELPGEIEFRSRTLLPGSGDAG